jgi:putative ABC transport system permease protein
MMKQLLFVTAMNLRNLRGRLWSSMVVVIGMAGVVGVFVSMLAMSDGFLRAVNHAGRADRAIVIRAGSDDETGSSITRDDVAVVTDAAGVKKALDGKPLASPEVVAATDRRLRESNTDANLTLRGISIRGLEVRPEIHLVEGRLFRPGLHEVIVGKSAQKIFEGLNIGDHLHIRDSRWEVVGVFASDGDAHESEVFGDGETLLAVYHNTLYNSLVVMLDSSAAFDVFKSFLINHPQLTVDVYRESEFRALQAKEINELLRFIAHFLGGVMAIGATLAALNTLYSAVSARSLEIAMLRAIGFGASGIVLSVFVEAIALSLVGGSIGALLAWLLYNGKAVDTRGGAFIQMVFHIDVTPMVVAQGMTGALMIGLVGGLLPAIRAAKLQVATALRAVV